MNKTKSIEKGFRGSLWLLYIVIVFEILYMISPFALYYYSLYKAPLNFLQSNPYTSFLTQNILPHFTGHTDLFINILNIICWPLIIIGLLLFLYSFFQIYWAKFRRKGIVSKGLYTIIRHPQYVSLAILGLGSTIYWPRFIVYIMYFTMLFLYFFLAKQEEKICMAKYGESYKNYCEKTGMFFPKVIENKFRKLPHLLPAGGLKRMASLLSLYVIYILILILFGFTIRNYSISRINAHYTDDSAVVSTAPLTKGDIQKALNIAVNNEEIKEKFKFINLEKRLIYIVPYGWSIPELGIGLNENQNYLVNSAAHGNTNDFNRNLLIVMITKPILQSGNEKGKEILKNSVSFIPYLEITVDMNKNTVISMKERKDKGVWDGIPVPVY